MFADEDLHRHAVENLNRADALLFGRVTYEMMEAAFRPPCAGIWGRPFSDDLAVLCCLTSLQRTRFARR